MCEEFAAAARQTHDNGQVRDDALDRCPGCGIRSVDTVNRLHTVLFDYSSSNSAFECGEQNVPITKQISGFSKREQEQQKCAVKSEVASQFPAGRVFEGSYCTG